MAKHAKKVSVLLGHLKNISLLVACYDTLSNKNAFDVGSEIIFVQPIKDYQLFVSSYRKGIF